MSQIQKSQGIVIKKSDYKENANIITLLTKEGKMSLIVRGSKKINGVTRNYTNLFTQLDFNATDKLRLNTLTEAIITNSFINIFNDVDKMNAGMIILEKINLLTDEIQCTELFYEFVLKILNLLNNTNYPYTVSLIFEVKLLYLLGVSPELRHCILCKSELIDDAVFSIYNGGIVCKEHLINNFELNTTCTNALKLMYFIKPDKIDESFLSLVNEYTMTISNVIDKFYEKHLDFYSKAKKIIYEIIK